MDRMYVPAWLHGCNTAWLLLADRACSRCPPRHVPGSAHTEQAGPHPVEHILDRRSMIPEESVVLFTLHTRSVPSQSCTIKTDSTMSIALRAALPVH